MVSPGGILCLVLSPSLTSVTVFAVPTRTFMRYQIFTWLPWWFKRYVLWQKSAVLTPLYHFDRVERVHSEDESVRGANTKMQGAELHEDATEKS